MRILEFGVVDVQQFVAYLHCSNVICITLCFFTSFIPASYYFCSLFLIFFVGGYCSYVAFFCRYTHFIGYFGMVDLQHEKLVSLHICHDDIMAVQNTVTSGT